MRLPRSQALSFSPQRGGLGGSLRTRLPPLGVTEKLWTDSLQEDALESLNWVKYLLSIQ